MADEIANIKDLSDDDIVAYIHDIFGPELSDPGHRMGAMTVDIIHMMDGILDKLGEISERHDCNVTTVMLSFLGYVHGMSRTTFAKLDEEIKDQPIIKNEVRNVYKLSADIGQSHAALKRYLDIIAKRRSN